VNQPSIIVLDFETSGMAPDRGDRVIEVGAVRISDGQIVERFQSLVNSGLLVSPFIESYTGITNAMLRSAPDSREVMRAFARFVGNNSLVAHNASFDSRFLAAEWARVGLACVQEFACSMLVARRVYPDAPNHKLETLVRYKNLPVEGSFHRALADAEMTAHLWLGMERDIGQSCGVERVPFSIMKALGSVKLKRVSDFLGEFAAGG